MDIDAINHNWENDKSLRNLQQDILYIPNLHHKYYKIYLDENMVLQNLRIELAVLEREKFSFYKDGPSKEDRKKKWSETNAKGAIKNKNELDILMNGDADILIQRGKVDKQELKVEFLIDILKQINSRSFQIQIAIDIRKFEAGLNT